MIKFITLCIFLFHSGVCCASKQHNVTAANHTSANVTAENSTSVNATLENATSEVTTTKRPRGRFADSILADVKRVISAEELVLPTDPPRENITLAELDERIVAALGHLRRTKNIDVRLQLLKDTFTYYSDVDDIADKFVEDYFEGIKVIKESGVLVKPKLIDMKYDDKILQEKYGWDEKEVDELFTNLGGCKYVWERVQRLVNETAVPTTTVTTTTTTTTSTTPIPTTTRQANFSEISAETVEFSEVSDSGEGTSDDPSVIPTIITNHEKTEVNTAKT